MKFAFLFCSAALVSLSAVPSHAEDESATAAIFRASEKVDVSGNALGKACGVTIRDNAQDKLDQVRLRYVDCVLVLRELNRAAPDLKVDEGDKGRALKIAYEKWLKAQVVSMQTTGLDYIAVVEDEELTSTERQEKLLDLVKRQTEIEKPFNDQLNDAIEAYDGVALDVPEKDKVKAPSSNKGKIEGTKWSSIDMVVDGKKIPDGTLKTEFSTDGKMAFVVGGNTFTGRYDLKEGDKVIFNFDQELEGEKIHEEKIVIKKNRMILTDADGTSIEFENVK